MKKETVTIFNLEAAFKALDEIETPKASGERFKANRVNLKEYFNTKTAHEVLVEDYFDVNDTDDLNAAKEEREAEVAKAKLARIEKIVDLDAETEEDILPSYVGKMIMQCPQCMTLFYKNEEDIEKSEDTPDVVNINEICQHCGNSSGYTLVGKVGGIDESEAENFDLDEVDIDENELNLDFPDEGTEEVDAEGTGEAEEAMEDEDLDLDLNFDEGEEESEETNESLHNSELLDKIEDKNDLKTEIESEHLTLNEDLDEEEIMEEDFAEEEHIEEGFLDKFKKSIPWNKLKDTHEVKLVQAKDLKKGDLIIDAGFDEDCPYDDSVFERVSKVANVKYEDGSPAIEIFSGLSGSSVADPEYNYMIAVPATMTEDLADWYRKKFDKPASVSTQQAWEDELNDDSISDARRKHLERKFQQQRDWEERHPDKVPPCPVLTPKTAAEEVTELDEPIAVGESMHNSELLNKIEDKNDLKTDIKSDHLTLNECEQPVADKLEEDATDKLFDELWSGKQPTDEETRANLDSLGEATTQVEDFEELDDAFDEHITEYLKEVYSNIETYNSTNCSMRGNKLVVEGLIKFQSGKTKTTRFTFDSNKRINNTLVFRGMNEGLTSDRSAFRLACRTDNKKLVTENLSYKYTIDGANVTGKTKKH